MQTTILNSLKMEESPLKEQKTLWEKVKLLVTSNFSFSHSVFKRLVLQTRKIQGLFGKGLRPLRKKCIWNTLYKMGYTGNQHFLLPTTIFGAFVKDNATMSLIRYFENHVSYFVQNGRK